MTNTYTYIHLHPFTVQWTELDRAPTRYGFFILTYVALMVAGVAMAEVIMYASDHKRDAYTGVPASAFAQFLFSGLFLKFQSFPAWLVRRTLCCVSSTISPTLYATLLCITHPLTHSLADLCNYTYSPCYTTPTTHTAGALGPLLLAD